MLRLKNSLYWRLALWLLAILVTVWMAAWLGSRTEAADKAADIADRQLKTSATLLLAAHVGRIKVRSGHGHRDTMWSAWGVQRSLTQSVETRPGFPSFEISDSLGRIIQRTKHFPSQARLSHIGFQNHTVDGRVWRVYTIVDRQSGLFCRVAADQASRDARTASLDDALSYPFLLLLPALVFGALFSVRQGLAPLKKIEKAIAEADPAKPAPLNISRGSVPRELRRLVAVLDDLFERLGDLLAKQRVFIDGAAHELRTPLAGCKIQLQVIERSTSEPARQHAVTQVQRAIDRMTRLVGQLLILARTDADSATLETQPFDCCRLVLGVIDEKRAMAEQKDVSLRLENKPGRAMLCGDKTLIEAMFANVLDNAIEFSPAHARVDIQIALAASTIEIRVRDRGPGVTSGERDYLFERFYRGRRSGDRGLGLGLAIVQAVVKAHAGDVRLDSARNGGTEVVVCLPADAGDADSV